MTARPTFHTPSFGDEEFEILASPSIHDQNQLTNISNDLSSSSVMSPSTMLNSLQTVPNQSTTNQWQAFDFQVSEQQSVSNDISSSVDNSDYLKFNNQIGMLSGSSEMLSEESDIGKLNTAVGCNEDVNKIKKKTNEIQKPLTAYALFFRDTQAPIKKQNPNASFADILKIVASIWDSLDVQYKNLYKKKAEIAKREYLKKLTSSVDETNSSIGANQENSEVQQNNFPINTMSTNYVLEDNNIVNLNSNIQLKPSIDKTNISSGPDHVNVVTFSKVSTEDSTNSSTVTNIPVTKETKSQQLGSLSSNTINTQENSDIGKQAKCVRDGCNNPPIVHPDWADEYCSYDCVVIHCRNVFSQWVQANMNNSNLQQIENRQAV